MKLRGLMNRWRICNQKSPAAYEPGISTTNKKFLSVLLISLIFIALFFGLILISLVLISLILISLVLITLVLVSLTFVALILVTLVFVVRLLFYGCFLTLFILIRFPRFWSSMIQQAYFSLFCDHFLI